MPASSWQNFQRAEPQREYLVQLSYLPHCIEVQIADDGKGLQNHEAAVLTGALVEQERIYSGHGLRGMRERAQHLGGELEVWSEPGAGTEIELRIPAVIAYETVISKNGFWRFWRRERSQ